VKIDWTAQATRDLDGAGAYIARENRQAAGRVVLRISEAAARLSDFPRIGRLGKLDGTRELVVAGTPFVVVYRVVDGLVEILRVIHGAQHWPDESA